MIRSWFCGDNLEPGVAMASSLTKAAEKTAKALGGKVLTPRKKDDPNLILVKVGDENIAVKKAQFFLP